MTNELYFQETCEVFDLRTCSDTKVLAEKFIDPCSCYHYYQCSNNYELIHQECSPGTAWDQTNGCIHYRSVILYQPCDENTNVWTRCNTTVSESRLDELKYICTNETQTTTTARQPVTTLREARSDKVSPGVIVGSIIGGAVIAVIVLSIAFVLYRRQKKRSSINKKRPTIAHNAEYFEDGRPDDPYAVINDSHVITDSRMANPTYNGSGQGGTMNPSNGLCTNAGFDGTEDTVYDNSGARIVGTGYTSTIRRSIREYETPASASSIRVDTQAEETRNHVTGNQSANVENVNVNEQKGGNLYVDLNGNDNKSNDGEQSQLAESGAPSVAPDVSEYTKGHTNENTPDYFVLEASGT